MGSVAAYLLLNLWSGCDAGMQKIAPQLLAMQGISIKQTTAGRNSCCAFLSAFLGVWPQHVLDAFEIDQRSSCFSIDRQDVMLATVNALSFPLYVLPFGGVVAKLGEYLNQCPVYVAGQGFLWSSFFVTLTYAIEYVLVLIVSTYALTSVEPGIADSQAETEANTEGNELVAVLVCLFTLMLIRFFVGAASGFLSKRSRAEPGDAHNEAAESKANAADADETNSKISQTSLENRTNCIEHNEIMGRPDPEVG